MSLPSHAVSIGLLPTERPGLRLVKSPLVDSISIEIQPAAVPTSYRVSKRIFDVLLAAGIGIAAAPIMVLVAIAIRATSKGPVLLKQPRLTLGGKVFTLYKFRTMRCDAETCSGPVFAGTRDPRVTPIGMFLRRTRLDELPQLLNVVVGDMSMIGPRPERPEMAEELRKEIPSFNRRMAAKAGLTGLAQVIQGYPDSTDAYRRKVAWDLVYIRKQSFILDLWIAFKTIGVVLTGHGAR